MQGLGALKAGVRGVQGAPGRRRDHTRPTLGDGLWYISENGKTPDKKQYTTLRLYRWTGAEDGPFEPVD